MRVGRVQPAGRLRAGLSARESESADFHGGGTDPAWSKNGGELFYLAADRNLTAEPYRSTVTTFEQGVGKVLFPVPGNVVRRSQAVTGDGRRFLIGKPVDESISESITVVLNWVDELKPRVPSK